ncbi:MAG: cytidylate kinase-like family protein [Lachnospiraceae bacterium]|nr:cytidylate kinase-like family protein [Lachnospiraceae bacterium]
MIGRCGDYILRDNSDCLHIFIYSHYTDRPWGIPQNYDSCLNSGALGEEVCANIITNVFKG